MVERKKKQHRYVTVKLPNGLVDKIDELVTESNGDFTSRTDVIKYSVRILYDDLIRG